MTPLSPIDEELFANITLAVEEQTGDAGFDPTWAMIITWADQSPFSLDFLVDLLFTGVFEQHEVFCDIKTFFSFL